MLERLREAIFGKPPIDSIARLPIVTQLGVKEIGPVQMEHVRRESNDFYLVDGNKVILYPPNHPHEKPTFQFFSKSPNGPIKITDNSHSFEQITNLPALLKQVTDIMAATIDSRSSLVVDPYNDFFIELTDSIIPGYVGLGQLVIEDRKKDLDYKDALQVDEAQTYFANHFLDHFIGFNFGIVVNHDQALRDELHALNANLIQQGRRVALQGGGHEIVERKGSVEPYTFPTS